MKKAKDMTREEFRKAITATVIAVVGILPTDTTVDVVDRETGEVYAYTDPYEAPQLFIPEWYEEEEVCFAEVIKMEYKTSKEVVLWVALSE